MSERARWEWKIVEHRPIRKGAGDLPSTGTAPALRTLDGAAIVTSFGISGSVDGVLMPGRSLPVDLSFTNPYGYSLRVVSLQISVRTSTIRGGRINTGCRGNGNLRVVKSLTATAVIAAHETESLLQLGVPRSSWPVVLMPNLSTNQDACKNTTFLLDYHGTAIRS